MRLAWHDFPVSLPHLGDLLDAIARADGIVATPYACYAIEKQAFDSATRDLIQAYWDGLTAEGEAEKIAQRKLAEAQATRQNLKALITEILEEP